MQQDPEEFNWFMSQIKPFKSILVIGSYDGSDLLEISKHIEPMGRILVIDIGSPLVQDLKANVVLLDSRGFDASYLIEDSKSQEAIDCAKAYAPYDVVFIDGDHSYEGVKADCKNYGRLSNTVAFHDINGVEPGIKRFWEELLQNNYVFRQFARTMQGVGIITNVNTEAILLAS